MSLHSQLLRGVLALPLMLLLAIAGVIAPDATHSSPAADAAAAHHRLVFKGSLPGSCPHRIVRVQLAAR